VDDGVWSMKGFKIICESCGSDDVQSSVDYNLSFCCISVVCMECDNHVNHETVNLIENGKITDRIFEG
jgi:hypothetical protein